MIFHRGVAKCPTFLKKGHFCKFFFSATHLFATLKKIVAKVTEVTIVTFWRENIVYECEMACGWQVEPGFSPASAALKGGATLSALLRGGIHDHKQST